MTAILQVLKPIPVKEYKAMLKKGKSKYGNKKVIVDGIKFDSIKESKRYLYLKSEQDAGRIYGLCRQQTHNLIINDILICSYKSDFEYTISKNHKPVIEDVKSKFTSGLPMFKLKKRLMLALKKLEIIEVI